jgi:hypothetical protein
MFRMLFDPRSANGFLWLTSWFLPIDGGRKALALAARVVVAAGLGAAVPECSRPQE